MTIDSPFADLPRNHYRVIYADPPWVFQVYSEKGKSRSAERHYSCMTLDEIKALPVAEIAASDCILFLWTTFPHLLQAQEVIKAWDFAYKTTGFIWIKQNPNGTGLATGTGYYTRANAEPCLIAGKGKRGERQSNNVHSVVIAPRREHSRKPDEVAARIVQLMGDVPRIELFARGSRPGWDVWGDEAVQSQPSALPEWESFRARPHATGADG